MRDVNFIKSQLESWRKCINWIDNVYPQKIFELDHELQNFKGISYGEKVSSSGIDEGKRKAILIDKKDDVENYKKHCENVIEFCENVIERVRPQYREVFEYRYKYDSTISYASYRTGFEAPSIYSIIDRETERLANE